MSTDGFLTRAEVDLLAEKLSHMSDIEREAAIALTGQSTQRPDGSRRGVPESTPPFPVHIADMLDELQNELVGAVRHVSESRGMEIDCSNTLVGMSKWLTRWRFALSMMPDAGETFDGLCRVIDKARRMLGHSEREYVVDRSRVEDANRQIVTAWQVEKLAPKLGEQGVGLNRQRIARLVACGALSVAVEGDAETRRHYLGDVLFAHVTTPRRTRAAYGRST